MIIRITSAFIAIIMGGSTQAGPVTGASYSFTPPAHITGEVKLDALYNFSWPGKNVSFMLAIHPQQSDGESKLTFDSFADKMRAEAVTRLTDIPVGHPNVITGVETNALSIGIFKGNQYSYSADNPSGYSFKYILFVLSDDDQYLSGILTGIDLVDHMEADVRSILESGTRMSANTDQSNDIVEQQIE